MLLSIGMIVKNEEKYLEKCLTALKPILENVDSELIIADTGSTDNTFEIAKKFTDNVFHFEWINDFAAARNSTLDKAKGEWYMFLDADEIITDCTEMIEFFNSGEYKKYGSGTIVVKNYNDLSNMDIYNSYNLHRLTALSNGVRFERPVHETFNKYFTPVKNFKTAADHYGYVYKENGKIIDNFVEDKTSRNLDLLFQELERAEKEGEVKDTIYGQIADCYLWRGDCDNALKYINMGMEKCRPESYVNIDYYNKKIKALSKMGNHKEIIETCRQYFSKDNRARKGRLVTDSNIYFYWASASYALEDFDEVINKAALGLEIYKSYRTGKLFTPELNFVGIETTVPALKQICNMFIIACDRQNRYNDALSQMSNIPLNDFMPDKDFMLLHLKIRTELMEHTNYNKLPDLYYQLDKPNKEVYINILIRNVFKTEKIDHFLKKLSLIAGEDERLADILKILNGYFIDHHLIPAQTTEFIKKHGAKNNEAVWILMMKSDFDIMPFICAEDFDPKESVENVYDDIISKDPEMTIFANSINRLSKEGVIKAFNVFETAVVNATEKQFNTSKVIRSLGQLGKHWTELYPDEEIAENVAFALEIGEAAELHRKKNYAESIARLEELEEKVGNDFEEGSEGDSEPSSDNVKTKIIQHYLGIVRADEEKNNEMMEKHNANPMLVVLAEQIKQEIRAMIDNWDLDGAESALNEMARMAPFDPDIEDIRDEIKDRKINYMNYM